MLEGKKEKMTTDNYHYTFIIKSKKVKVTGQNVLTIIHLLLKVKRKINRGNYILILFSLHFSHCFSQI